jgi:hypothetical protein
VALTFVVGTAADVFPDDLARAVDAQLRARFAAAGVRDDDPYESEPLDASGWRLLQQRVLRTLDTAPHLTGIDAYQAVYLPGSGAAVEHVAIPNAADPLQVGSITSLIEELNRFASSASLPTDDVELMELAAQYLESEDAKLDLDVQTYVQLMLSAKQAAARKQALWIVV